MSTTFIKRNPQAPTGFFETEAAGLKWLAQGLIQGGVAVAQVEEVSATHIAVKREIQVPPTAAMAVEFGRQLARTHQLGVDEPVFGPGPASHQYGELFIGRLPMPGEKFEHWGEFYATTRVQPFLGLAEQAANLSASGRKTVQQACDRIASGIFDDDAPPRRIHGDLWNGNVLWTDIGVVLIDPAAHHGHGETDLAMLALFGCPYLEYVYQGYGEVLPLKAGWQDRIALHQLHPLAVHAVGHGPSYGVELVNAARHVLSMPAPDPHPRA